MRTNERIPLHDHADGNSGGPLSGNTLVTVAAAPSGGSSTGGFDGIAEHLSTTETDTTKRLAPNGSGGVQWVAEASGLFPWFNVMDPAYGAVNDGSTDDTTAINAAIAALTAAGRGRLYFPAGLGYHVPGGVLSDITVPCIILGDGGSWNIPTDAATRVMSDSTTAVLFSVKTNEVSFQDLAVQNTNAAGTVTAGAGIQIPAGGGSRARGYGNHYTRVSVNGFWRNIDHQEGGLWTMTDCTIRGSRSHGLFIKNTTSPDEGDWSVLGCNFVTDLTTGSPAAIHIESANGGKISNTKINSASAGFANGIELRQTPGAQGGVLLLDNLSIEGMSGNAIDLSNSGSDKFPFVVIHGIETGLYVSNSQRAVNISGGGAAGFSYVVIDDIVVNSTAANAGAAIVLTNVDHARVDAVEAYNFASLLSTSGCTNVIDNTNPGSGGFANPMTTEGDLIYQHSGSPARLGVGGANTVLHGGTDPAYSAVVEADLSLSDVTTDNVTSTAHGLAPKSPADATKFLNGAATPAYAQVKDSDLSTSDVTTNDVGITKHGFAPKAPNDTTKFLRGDGSWATVPGSVVGVGTYGLLVEDGVTAPPVNLYTEDGKDWLYADG